MEQNTKLAGIVKLTILLFLAVIAGTLQAQNTATCNITIASSNNPTMPNLCTGSAGASASGGTVPYTYSWSNGAATASVSALCKGCYTLTVTDAQACTQTSVVCIKDSSSGNNCSSLMLASSGVNSTSNTNCTGMVSATAWGGTSPYTYSWSNGAITKIATGICAGCYTVKVTDAKGCTRTSMTCITGPCSMSVNVTGTAPTGNNCNGSATANVSGGTSPYTYSWWSGAKTQSISNLCGGCYLVVVSDANGCTATDSICYNVGCSFMFVSAWGTNATSGCNGSAYASAGGGTAPYTYSWSSGAMSQGVTQLCAGCYTVTATDANGCTKTAKVCITGVNSNCNSMVITTSGTNPSSNNTCDGSLSVVPSGGTAPYTYQWSTNAQTASVTGLCTGCYWVIVSDAKGCSRYSAACIKGPGNCGLTAIVSATNPGNNCNGTAVATVSGGTAPYTYKWSTGATTPAISSLCKGCYKVLVKDAKGCKAKSIVCLFGGSEPPPFQQEMEEELMSVEPDENDAEDVVDMYPNPSSGSVMLVYAAPATGKIQISVKDIVGREVYREVNEAHEGKNAYTLDLSALGKGMYLLEVTCQVSGKQSTRKLLIE